MYRLNQRGHPFLFLNKKEVTIKYREQRGMVLLITLSMIMLITGLVTYLASLHCMHLKLGDRIFNKTQQFEIAEIGLLAGEKELRTLMLNKTFHSNQPFRLSPVTYKDYYITLEAIQLPKPFCLTPMRTKGYYYELTATAESTKRKKVKQVIQLQSIVAVPSDQSCDFNLSERQAGRCAWCQLQ